MFGHQDESKTKADDQVGAPAADNDTSDVSPVSAPVSPAIFPQASTPLNDDATDTPSAPDVTLPSSGSSSAGGDDALLDIKQGALQQLTPLIGHLEQSPEEKFRTTMMMIQASDNQSLIKTAYDAAQAITDEKARAQALLDIVNEINYFTQHQK